MVLYSLVTDYELGVLPQISMRTHLMLDLIGGALLALSPWLFGFAEYEWGPHFIFGILEMGAALTTDRTPGTDRHLHRSHHHTAAMH